MLVGYSPWDCKESDVTNRRTLHTIICFIILSRNSLPLLIGRISSTFSFYLTFSVSVNWNGYLLWSWTGAFMLEHPCVDCRCCRGWLMWISGLSSGCAGRCLLVRDCGWCWIYSLCSVWHRTSCCSAALSPCQGQGLLPSWSQSPGVWVQSDSLPLSMCPAPKEGITGESEAFCVPTEVWCASWIGICGSSVHSPLWSSLI